VIGGLVYLDASAIVKLVGRERESAELAEWLSLRDEAVSSALSSMEVRRALRRAGASAEAFREAERQLQLVTLVEVQSPVLELAGRIPGAHLRSLDAIHLATALSIGALPDAFLTYDARLADAATRQGLAVVHPGADALTP
jgi:predicted nucleic acid-binding protein